MTSYYSTSSIYLLPGIRRFRSSALEIVLYVQETMLENCTNSSYGLSVVESSTPKNVCSVN